MTPVVATTAHQRCAAKVPSNDKNSPTNPENAGSPMPAKVATRNSAVSFGADFQMPPNSSIWRVCRRS